MIDDGSRGHGLASARRALDETEWTLQRRLHSKHLRVVEFRETGCREATIPVGRGGGGGERDKDV